MKKKEIKVSDLIPDNKNFNKGTEFGNSLIEKSLRENGAGRSILLDKNNNIIAGNKTAENAVSIGMDDLIIVESDGTKIVAVKRTDIDIDTPEGRKMALADNASAKANISWDFEMLESEFEVPEMKEWGISDTHFETPNLDHFFEQDNSELKRQTHKIILEYNDDEIEEIETLFKKHQGTKSQIVAKLLSV